MITDPQLIPSLLGNGGAETRSEARRVYLPNR
jgi:hypothetical protein